MFAKHDVLEREYPFLVEGLVNFVLEPVVELQQLRKRVARPAPCLAALFFSVTPIDSAHKIPDLHTVLPTLRRCRRSLTG
jgi:hypothetical protein